VAGLNANATGLAIFQQPNPPLAPAGGRNEMDELTIPAWRDDEGIGTLQDDEPESYCPNCAYDLPCDGKCKYWQCANEDLPLFNQ